MTGPWSTCGQEPWYVENDRAHAYSSVGIAKDGEVKAIAVWTGEDDHADEMVAALNACRWLPIETAPKDKTPVIIAVPDRDRSGFIVGEAYFDPENYGDGDWWWAGTHHTDYHSGPISEMNHHGPMFWQAMPAAPGVATLSASDADTSK